MTVAALGIKIQVCSMTYRTLQGLVQPAFPLSHCHFTLWLLTTSAFLKSPDLLALNHLRAFHCISLFLESTLFPTLLYSWLISQHPSQTSPSQESLSQFPDEVKTPHCSLRSLEFSFMVLISIDKLLFMHLLNAWLLLHPSSVKAVTVTVVFMLCPQHLARNLAQNGCSRNNLFRYVEINQGMMYLTESAPSPKVPSLC